MTATPLAYDGRRIYAISTQRDRDAPKVILEFYLEQYELRDKTLHFVKRARIMKDIDYDEPMKLKKISSLNLFKTEEGLLDHASMVSNG